MKCQTRYNRTKAEPSKAAEHNEGESSEDITEFEASLIIVLLMLIGMTALFWKVSFFIHSVFHIPFIGQ